MTHKSCHGCKYLYIYDTYHSYCCCTNPKKDGCANPTKCELAIDMED